MRITDDFKRKSVFDLINANADNSEFVTGKYTIWQAGNKPLTAFLVGIILFFWIFYYAVQLQNGTVYEIKNGHSITGIVLAIASMGVTKVIILFSILLSIPLLAFIRKATNPPIMNRIVIKR